MECCILSPTSDGCPQLCDQSAFLSIVISFIQRSFVLLGLDSAKVECGCLPDNHSLAISTRFRLVGELGAAEHSAYDDELLEISDMIDTIPWDLRTTIAGSEDCNYH